MIKTVWIIFASALGLAALIAIMIIVQRPVFNDWIFSKATGWRPKIGTVYTVQASAYASSPYQTDSTPCITAAGTRVRQGVAAANFLPLGTIFSIEDDLYIVEDRMNSRYNGQYIDLWFPSTSSALEFGRRKLDITIVDFGTPGQALEKSETGEIVQPSILKRANMRFLALGTIVQNSLKAAVSDRYDVDCSKTE